MRACGALALRSPSSWKPVRDGRRCPLSVPVLEPPRLRPLPDRGCPRPRPSSHSLPAPFGRPVRSQSNFTFTMYTPSGGVRGINWAHSSAHQLTRSTLRRYYCKLPGNVADSR
eukprot:4267862-Pleurochrysis_carterae.AAC.1